MYRYGKGTEPRAWHPEKNSTEPQTRILHMFRVQSLMGLPTSSSSFLPDSPVLLPRQSPGNMSCSPVGHRAVGEKTNVLWEGWLQGHTGVSSSELPVRILGNQTGAWAVAMWGLRRQVGS